MLRLVVVAGVDDRPERAGVHLGAAEGVVELVHREEGRDAHVAELVEARVDMRRVALRFGIALDRLAAVQNARELDALDHGELALDDDPSRLRGSRDDPQPAFARAAVLRVDVVLEVLEILVLEPDAVHVVARTPAAPGP